MIDKAAFLVSRMKNMIQVYRNERFIKAASPVFQIAETDLHFRRVPSRSELDWRPAKNAEWGHSSGCAWFRAEFEVPPELDGKELWLAGDFGGMEGLFFLDGTIRGTIHPRMRALEYAFRHVYRAAGIFKAGEKHEFAVEMYAGHSHPGMTPLDKRPPESSFRHACGEIRLYLRNDEVYFFCLELGIMVELAELLSRKTLRSGRILAGLEKIRKLVPGIPSERPAETVSEGIRKARGILKELLSARNGSSTPLVAMTGHSHLDTAWLWTIDETVRKTARTFANACDMLDRYPDYIFVQSSPIHADMLRREYPAVFERVRRFVAQQRWEPNGGAWVESDCNMPSGESLARQYLYGQSFTGKHFGIIADCFFMPDTFGFNAQLPQILRQSGIRFVMTTKLSWNDTNKFPYDTFRWRGLDGSEVLTHFAKMANDACPQILTAAWSGTADPTLTDSRYLLAGEGDGGGGPNEEVIDQTSFLKDLEGLPKTEFLSVSGYMKKLEKELSGRLPLWSGELYLELHRGTLTSIPEIKKGNRLAETALREAEIAGVLANKPASFFEGIWKKLLINQFHDILPGSSINEVNERTIAELEEVRREAGKMTEDALTSLCTQQEGTVSFFNPAPYPSTRTFRTELPDDFIPESSVTQTSKTLDGKTYTAIAGLTLSPLGLTSRKNAPSPAAVPESPFQFDGHTLETPLLRLEFDKEMRIVRWFDKQLDSELVREGGVFNRFLCGESLPLKYDNWEIERDQASCMKEDGKLISCGKVSDGPLEFRLRTVRKIGFGSELKQDMIFFADRAEAEFETVVDWREEHSLLKAAFETNLNCSFARHEIQFGHIQRPTNRNTCFEQARFEVCNLRWSDLSENRRGLALFNDCKYGVSAEEGTLALTLLMGGTHPDSIRNKGMFHFHYGIGSHAEFSAENVVHPAWEFNSKIRTLPGKADVPLFRLDNPQIVLEAVKPAEDGSGFIARLYEAEGTEGVCRIESPQGTVLCECDFLENKKQKISSELRFHPFEIKTILLIRN